MRELEEKLATQDLAARSAAAMYQQEHNARMVAQQQEIEEMKRKRQNEIVAFEKAQEEKISSLENKQSQLEGVFDFILRMQRCFDNTM